MLLVCGWNLFPIQLVFYIDSLRYLDCGSHRLYFLIYIAQLSMTASFDFKYHLRTERFANIQVEVTGGSWRKDAETNGLENMHTQSHVSENCVQLIRALIIIVSLITTLVQTTTQIIATYERRMISNSVHLEIIFALVKFLELSKCKTISHMQTLSSPCYS